MHLATTAFNGAPKIFNDRIAELANIGDFTKFFENRDIGEKLNHSFYCGNTQLTALIDTIKLNLKIASVLKHATSTDIIEDDDENSITFKTSKGNLKIDFTNKTVTIGNSTFRYTKDGKIVEESCKDNAALLSKTTNTEPKADAKKKLVAKARSTPSKHNSSSKSVEADKTLAKYFDLKKDRNTLRFFAELSDEERNKFANKIIRIIPNLVSRYTEKDLANMKILIKDGVEAKYEDFTMIINNTTMLHCKFNPQTGEHDCSFISQ